MARKNEITLEERLEIQNDIVRKMKGLSFQSQRKILRSSLIFLGLDDFDVDESTIDD